MGFKGKAAAAFAALAFAASAACSAPPRRLPVEVLTIRTAAGAEVGLKAEIADDDAERERGLMFREEVADGEGMLFVFGADQRLAFWMKNTQVPLSIAFIASDGRILEIRDMEPFSLAPVESERSVRWALEVPRGWFGRAGVGAGDVVVRPRP